MAGTTWNPLDTHSRFTLSSGNHVATAASVATQVGTCITDGKTGSGKYYVELTIGGTMGGNTLLGVYTTSPVWGTVLTSDIRGAYCYAAFGLFYNGSNTGLTLGGFTAGDVICIAFDLDNSKAWFRKNVGNWNGNAAHNPATNAGGISISTLVATGRPWFVMAGAGSGAAPSFTLNSGDSAFVQTVPTGFTAGWPANAATSVATAFDTATATGSLSFANGNLTAIGAGVAGIQTAKATQGASSGQYYFEFYVNETLTTTTGIGVARNVTLGSSYFNTATDGVVLYSTGGIWVNGSQVTANNATLSYLAGQVVGVALDLDNDRIWMRVSDSIWNNDASANPATNTNGKDISSLAGNILPAFCCNNGANIKFSLNNTNYTKLPGPAGFTVGPPTSIVTSLRRRRLIVA